MTDFQDIVELFSYSQQEQATFPYLHRYMRKIQPRLPHLLNDAQVRERFMLAGLFLTYRAFNHGGGTMTTELNSSNMIREDIHTERLRAYKQITGKSIGSTAQYLKMIRFNILKVLVIGPANMLYSFVVHG